LFNSKSAIVQLKQGQIMLRLMTWWLYLLFTRTTCSFNYTSLNKTVPVLNTSWHVPNPTQDYRKVSRCQSGNQNPSIEGQTTQWEEEKGQTKIYKTLHTKLKIEQHKPH